MEPYVVFAILAFAAVGAIGWWSHVRKKRRRQDIASVAARYGFSHSPDDVSGILLNDFELLRRGDDRGCENVVTGRWKGMPFSAADYWYYTESTDKDGGTTRDYEHFSICVIDVPVDLPPLSVGRETFFSRAGGRLGLRDIEFESDEFNRRFQVRSDHRRFAYELIDTRMMLWLLSIDDRIGLELRGTKGLVYSRRLEPSELVMLVGTGKELLERLPRLVLKTYGSQGAAREEAERA
ncbi:MAG: hypothetical protein ABR575_02440 [Actinomycetota bacterium]